MVLSGWERGAGPGMGPPPAPFQSGARQGMAQAEPWSVKVEKGEPWQQWTPPPPSPAPLRGVRV